MRLLARFKDSQIYPQDHLLNAAFDSLARRHSFAHTGLNHYVLREYISTNFPDPSSVTVYSGEFSDGAHNWDLVKIWYPISRQRF